MVNHIELAEKQIETFLPLIQKTYPVGRKDAEELKEWISKYEDMTMADNVVIALFDHKTQGVFFISENIEQLSGFSKKQISSWGSLLPFRVFHYTQYSYPFKTLKWAVQFHKNTSIEHKKNIKLYSSGVKLVDKKRNVRHAFLKRKTLILDNQNMPDISIFFIEEVTHLVKGNHYWFRLISPEASFAYINQKGKKEFSDIISTRELDILKLLGEKKSSNEIADELFLSKLTVETHRKNMIQRTDALNATALVHLAKMANII